MEAPVPLYTLTEADLCRPLREVRADFERAYLLAQMRQARAMKQAAYAAGVERSYLHRKLKHLGIGRSDLVERQP